jgi:hypothetical protein
MSEETKKAEPPELSEQDLDKVAGGASQPLVPKPGTGTGPTYTLPPKGPQGKI